MGSFCVRLETAALAVQSMPIIEIINGKHYLIDFLYELKPMEEVYQAIVSKIAQHHITQLVVEINTDTSLVNLLQKMLREQGITFCKIISSPSIRYIVYSLITFIS